MKTIKELVCHIDQESEVLIRQSGIEQFELKEIVSTLNDSDFNAVIIDHSPVTDKETLLQALNDTLHFPGWFGFNWDSLKDVLTAIEGKRSKGFIFAFSDISQIDNDDRETLIDVIEDANEIREQSDGLGPLRVLALK